MPTPADVAKIIGEARGPIEFLMTFAQKSVLYFIIAQYLLLDYAARTITSNWYCSVILFGFSTFLGAVFIACESFKKCCKAKMLHENGAALPTDLVKP